MQGGYSRRHGAHANTGTQDKPRLRPEKGHDKKMKTHDEPLVRDAPPLLRKRMLRQVSWLSGHHALPAFPVLLPVARWGKDSPITVAGAAPDFESFQADSAPDSLLIPCSGKPSTTRSILVRPSNCNTARRSGIERGQAIVFRALKIISWLSRRNFTEHASNQGRKMNSASG
jgi:hypothetical protein